MNAIIVDDEPRALKVLETKLARHCPEISIIGKAGSAEEAFQLIIERNPDILFLDVAMPKESGFDLLNRLPHLNFETIFVTGYDDYAIEAFRFSAVGYVVKPIKADHLVLAIKNAKDRVLLKQENDCNRQLLHNITNPLNKDNRIGIPTSTGVEYLPTTHIVRCEGHAGYTKVIIENRKNLVSSYNLGEFRRLLEPYGFLLPHKSHLVNKSHLLRYDREGWLEMADGEKVPVARRKRQEFLDQLERL